MNVPITARGIARRRDRSLGTPKGKFEDPKIQQYVQMMCNKMRCAWARAGRPTDKASLEIFAYPASRRLGDDRL